MAPRPFITKKLDDNAPECPNIYFHANALRFDAIKQLRSHESCSSNAHSSLHFITSESSDRPGQSKVSDFYIEAFVELYIPYQAVLRL